MPIIQDRVVRSGMALEFIHPPQAAEVLLRMLDDPHATVRSMAARNLANRLAAETRWVGGSHRQAIDKLTAMFADHGQSAARGKPLPIDTAFDLPMRNP